MSPISRGPVPRLASSRYVNKVSIYLSIYLSIVFFSVHSVNLKTTRARLHIWPKLYNAGSYRCLLKWLKINSEFFFKTPDASIVSICMKMRISDFYASVWQSLLNNFDVSLVSILNSKRLDKDRDRQKDIIVFIQFPSSTSPFHCWFPQRPQNKAYDFRRPG